jgi:hypothetical protein
MAGAPTAGSTVAILEAVSPRVWVAFSPMVALRAGSSDCAAIVGTFRTPAASSPPGPVVGVAYSASL